MTTTPDDERWDVGLGEYEQERILQRLGDHGQDILRRDTPVPSTLKASQEALQSALLDPQVHDALEHIQSELRNDPRAPTYRDINKTALFLTDLRHYLASEPNELQSLVSEAIGVGTGIQVASGVTIGNIVAGGDIAGIDIINHIDRRLINVVEEHSSTTSSAFTNVISSDQAVERIGTAARLLSAQIEKNLDQARQESSQFFRLTLVFASLGFAVILAGVILLILGQVAAGVISSAASIIPEATAALFFNKDKELRKTIDGYHQQMVDSQQILTMVEVANTLEASGERDHVKQQIIYRSLNVPPALGVPNRMSRVVGPDHPAHRSEPE